MIPLLNSNSGKVSPVLTSSSVTSQSNATLLSASKSASSLTSSVTDKISKGNISKSRPSINATSTLAPKLIVVQVKKKGAAQASNGIFGDTTTKSMMAMDAMKLVEEFVLKHLFPSLNEPISVETIIGLYTNFEEALEILKKDIERKQKEAIRLEEERRREEIERAIQQDLRNRNKVCSEMPKLIQAYIDCMRKEIKDIQRQATAKEKWKKGQIENYKEVCVKDLAVVHQTPPQWVEHPDQDLKMLLSNSFVKQGMNVINMIKTEESVDLDEQLSMHSGSKRSQFRSRREFNLFRADVRRNIKIVGRRAFKFLARLAELRAPQYSTALKQSLEEFVIPRLAVFPDSNHDKTARVMSCLMANILGYIFNMEEKEEEEVDPIRNESISRILDDYELREQRKIIFGRI